MHPDPNPGLVLGDQNEPTPLDRPCVRAEYEPEIPIESETARPRLPACPAPLQWLRPNCLHRQVLRRIIPSPLAANGDRAHPARIGRLPAYPRHGQQRRW